MRQALQAKWILKKTGIKKPGKINLSGFFIYVLYIIELGCV
jgi:hypothetical protein